MKIAEPAARISRAEGMIAALPEIARSPAASAARGGRAPEPLAGAMTRVRKEIEKHRAKAAEYFEKLVALASKADTARPEVAQAKAFLGRR